MYVIKRDGSKEEYLESKVRNVIIQAFNGCGYSFSEDDIDSVVDELYLPGEAVSVEYIQDQLEDALMLSGFFEVAKAFILYRKEHSELRELEKLDQFITDFSEAENAATGSAVDANSNVSMKNIATMTSELPKEKFKKLNCYRIQKKLKKLYGTELSKQYKEDLDSHIIYKNDASNQGPYCVAITGYPFLLKGLTGLGGDSSEPHSIKSYIGQNINLLFTIAGQFAGAVAQGDFFVNMTWYCVKEWGEDWYKRLEEVVDLSLRQKTIRGMLEDYFQQWTHSINQPTATRGNQACFSNVSYFDKNYFSALFGDYCFPDGTKPDWEGLNTLQQMFMKWFNAERLRTMMTFPVETVALLSDGEDVKDKEWKDFTAEMYSEGHSFFTYLSDNADSLSSCCRLKNKLQANTFNFTNGNVGIATGSKSVITLNLNRIVQNWANDPNDMELEEYLIPILERVYKYHTAYNELLKDFYAHNMLTVYSAGFIDLKKQFLTIGLNGINEAAMFLGLKCNDNEDYCEFINLITSTITAQNTKHRTKELSFNTEFVPAEGLGPKNYKWDKEDGYIVPENRNCYTSYFFLPDDSSINIIEKFKLHGKRYVENLDGGQAAHINLQEHLSKEQYLKLIELACKEGTNYFTFNVPNSKCDDCGFITKHPIDVCPKCGSNHIIKYDRIIGYLTAIKNWEAPRKIEQNKRIYELVKENI